MDFYELWVKGKIDCSKLYRTGAMAMKGRVDASGVVLKRGEHKPLVYRGRDKVS